MAVSKLTNEQVYDLLYEIEHLLENKTGEAALGQHTLEVILKIVRTLQLALVYGVEHGLDKNPASTDPNL